MEDRSEESPGVHRVEKADARSVVPCLVRSFWEFPETCHLLPSEGNRRRVLPRYLASDAHDSAKFGALWASSEHGVVSGAAAWLPPDGYPVTLWRQLSQAVRLVPIAPWGIGAMREARRGQAANRARHAPCPPHYWLRVIGVDPDRQGEGIGTVLLRSMLDHADAEDRGCFLFTATDQNVLWYESFEFTTLSTYHPTSTWPQVWAMWRPVRRPGSRA